MHRLSRTELSVELRRLYEGAGRPTYATLIRQAKVLKPPVTLTDSTLSGWLHPDRPVVCADPRALRFLVEYLQPMAERRSGFRPRGVGWWEQLRARAWEETHARRGGRRRRVASDTAASVGGGGVGRLISDLTDSDALDLEVHPAIDSTTRPAGLPRLPIYVARDHDSRLRDLVRQAASGRSVAAVLVGGSSSGKTRACWEAIRELPDGWRLWHPIDPSRPEAVVETIATIGPRTVVWLNDAQHYLLPPTVGLGERVAAGLRTLLRDPARAPALILATIWPEHWAALSPPPDPAQIDDPHSQARFMFSGADIHVPESFNGPALAAVQRAAALDPRLAEAAAAEHGQVTQYLAGIPDLLQRYRNAPAPAKAVIDAAIDARRLGHRQELPQALVEAAAAGYLTDQQWDILGDDWLEQALAYAGAPCRGTRGPLTRRRARPGQPAGGQPRYRLADYLEQTGRIARACVLPPAELWDALLVHTDRSDLPEIALYAVSRGLYRYGHRMYLAAADAGDREAPREIARLLARTGRTEEAIEQYHRAAAGGSTDALFSAGWLLQEAGRLDESIACYQRAAEASADPAAVAQAANLLVRAGRIDEAISWLDARAEAGDPTALRQLAWLYAGAGRIDEAVDCSQRVVETGDPRGLELRALLLERAGRTDEAIEHYQRCVEAGDQDALRSLTQLLLRTGRTEEATDLCRQIAATGEAAAVRMMIVILGEAGHTDEAIEYSEQAADAGHSEARWWAADVLLRASRFDEAIRLYQRAADNGDQDALLRAASLLQQMGRTEEAIDYHQRAAQAGDTGGLQELAELTVRAGRMEDMLRVLQNQADVGEHNAARQLAELMHQAGRTDEAIDYHRRAALTGDSDALRRAVELLHMANRADEARRLQRYGLEPDGRIADNW